MPRRKIITLRGAKTFGQVVAHQFAISTLPHRHQQQTGPDGQHHVILSYSQLPDKCGRLHQAVRGFMPVCKMNAPTSRITSSRGLTDNAETMRVLQAGRETRGAYVRQS